MFCKLIKYDLRAAVKKFGIIVPAFLAVSFIADLFVRFGLADLESTDFLSTTGLIAAFFSGTGWVILLITMMILTTVFIIQRFYKGLLQDEGYLVHSLPVKTWQLVLSKFLTSLLLIFVMNLLVLFALSLFTRQTVFFKDLVLDVYFGNAAAQAVYDLVFSMTSSTFGAKLAMSTHYIVSTLINTAYPILTIYLSMAVGHLFSKHRVGMSVLFYIVVFQVLMPLLMIFPDPYTFFSSPSTSTYLINILTPLVIQLAVAIGSFFGTTYILKNHLNLE